MAHRARMGAEAGRITDNDRSREARHTNTFGLPRDTSRLLWWNYCRGPDPEPPMHGNDPEPLRRRQRSPDPGPEGDLKKRRYDLQVTHCGDGKDRVVRAVTTEEDVHDRGVREILLDAAEMHPATPTPPRRDPVLKHRCRTSTSVPWEN